MEDVAGDRGTWADLLSQLPLGPRPGLAAENGWMDLGSTVLDQFPKFRCMMTTTANLSVLAAS